MDAIDSPQGTVRAAFQARCPRCGRGPLFRGYLIIAPSCAACGLDYSAFDPGDGPAVFVILIVGFLVAGGALIVEVAFRPAYWVHAAIWLPTIFVLAFGFLRLVKSTLVVLQYKHRAGDAHLID
jgi:uncharacterized protein (DUF983 family)